jgi:hypothetical protein
MGRDVKKRQPATVADGIRQNNRLKVVGMSHQDEQHQEERPLTVETFSAADLMKMELPEQRWAIEGVLPDGCSIAAGKSKIGKSWLALNGALAVAQGGVALGKIDVEAGDVLYLALEDTKRRLKERLGILLTKQNGKAPERLTLTKDCPRADQGGLAFIDHWLSEHKEARLVIIDTWAKFKRLRAVRTNDYDADYQDASEIKAMADKHNVAVLIIHHCRKMPGNDPLEEVLGSMGLPGAVDNILVLRRDRGQQDATLHVMGRDVEEQELAMQWDAQYCLWSIMGNAEEYRVTNERQELIDILHQIGKPAKPTEIAPLLKKTLPATRMLLHRAWQAGHITNLGSGFYTFITQGAHDELPALLQLSSDESYQSYPKVTHGNSDLEGESYQHCDSHVIFHRELRDSPRPR